MRYCPEVPDASKLTLIGSEPRSMVKPSLVTVTEWEVVDMDTEVVVLVLLCVGMTKVEPLR